MAEELSYNNAKSSKGSNGILKVLPFLKERIEFEIPSRVEWMHEVLSYLIERTAHLGIIKPSTSNIFVALDEAIANAIKHGNKYDVSKRIHIVAEITSEEACFTITDEGEGFDLNSLPNPTDPDYIMRPCGRGVMLIYHIMDEVRYNTRGNQIVMIKRPETDGEMKRPELDGEIKSLEPDGEHEEEKKNRPESEN